MEGEYFTLHRWSYQRIVIIGSCELGTQQTPTNKIRKNFENLEN